MLATLDVPYIDTRAADLVWTLDHPVLPALTTTVATLAGPAAARLELRVLGASHQVVMTWPGGGVVETVACLPGEQPYLPESAHRDADGRAYRFRAHVDDVDDHALDGRVRMLRLLAQSDSSRDTTVLAAFPSDPHAVTALTLRSRTPRVGWQTWHVYPNSRQIVTTSTEVV